MDTVFSFELATDLAGLGLPGVVDDAVDGIVASRAPG